jgi:hypothetical protein
MVVVQVHRAAAIAAAQSVMTGEALGQGNCAKIAHQHFGRVMPGAAMRRKRIGEAASAYQFHDWFRRSSGRCGRRRQARRRSSNEIIGRNREYLSAERPESQAKNSPPSFVEMFAIYCNS